MLGLQACATVLLYPSFLYGFRGFELRSLHLCCLHFYQSSHPPASSDYILSAYDVLDTRNASGNRIQCSILDVMVWTWNITPQKAQVVKGLVPAGGTTGE